MENKFHTKMGLGDDHYKARVIYIYIYQHPPRGGV